MSLQVSTRPIDECKEQAPPFDVDGICNQIVHGGSADTVVDANPTILLSIANYSEKEFLSFFSRRFSKENQPKIESALRILYSQSLRNSSFNAMAQTLNSQITAYLRLSDETYFQHLEKEGNELLYQAQKGDLKGLKEQCDALLQVSAKITEVLSLYFYLDPDQKERIQKVAVEAVHFNGKPLYPICRNQFGNLCQNLEKTAKSKNNLSDLRKALMNKADLLRKEIKRLYPTTEPTLPADRQVFFQRYTTHLWDAGNAFIEQAFWTSFEEKRKNHTYLPEELVTAIRYSTQVHEDWRTLTFPHFVYYANKSSLPPGFAYQVWSEYLNKKVQMDDLGDLIRFLLRTLSQPAFEKLEADLKTSSDWKKTILEAFTQRAAQFTRGPITFMVLKRWIESA